ncbi:MAG: protein kinase [Deltaproteobacteria bacterium]|nr:protein kinase [Deltaproteobacteria bacterium]
MLAPSQIRPGHVFGKYTLVKPLGEGAFGGVWLAERVTNHQQHQLNRPVALKLRHRHESQTDMHDANLSFLRDWYVGNLIQHPNIVAIQDVVTEGPDIAIVMEWVDGYTFGDIFRRLTSLDAFLPLSAVLEAGIGVCAGLHALHSVRRPDGTPYNIVHRDIKPQNLMIDLHGVVRVLDLGIAKSEELPGERTAHGIAKGTIEYMAPEQYLSNNLSPATDLFALGVVLFELATKERLFRPEADDSRLFRRKRSGHAASRVTAHESRLGPLAPVLLDCLAIEPEDRPQSAEELGHTLQGLLDGAPRGPGLHDLMSAFRGEVPPRMAQSPEWAPLALALDRPRRPTPVVHLPRKNIALLLPGLDMPETIVEALSPIDEDGDVAFEHSVVVPATLPTPEANLTPLPLPDPPTRSLPFSPSPSPIPLSGQTTRIRTTTPSPIPPPTPTPPEVRPVTPPPPPTPIVAPPAPPPLVRAALVPPKSPTPPSPPPRVPIAALAPGSAFMSTKTPSPALVSAPSGAGERPSPAVEDEDDGRPTVLIVVAAMMAGVMLAAGMLVVSQIMFKDPKPIPEEVVVNKAAEEVPPEVSPPPEVVPPPEADPCDGVIDEDGDGYLPCDPKTEAALARVSLGELKANDCDDKDPKVYPGAKGDGRDVDNSCDGKIDGKERHVNEPAPPQETCFQDMDGDGYGNKLKLLRGEFCRGKNVSNNSEDCLDTNSRWHPGASEPAGSPDYNCDGLTKPAAPASPPPNPPRLLNVTSSVQGLVKKLTVNAKLDPNAGQCSALYVLTSDTTTFNVGTTTTHPMSGGPTDWRMNEPIDQKDSYFRLMCSDVAQGARVRIGAKYYTVSQ